MVAQNAEIFTEIWRAKILKNKANHDRVNLWRKFLKWARHRLLNEKKVSQRYLSPLMVGTMGNMIAEQRNTLHSFQTWKFVPKYETNPSSSRIFLYCDTIETISRRDALATHRLSMVLISPYQSRLYWSIDLQMTSLFGANNCAARTTESVARTLLYCRFDDLPPQKWMDRAQSFAEGFARR